MATRDFPDYRFLPELSKSLVVKLLTGITVYTLTAMSVNKDREIGKESQWTSMLQALHSLFTSLELFIGLLSC